MASIRRIRTVFSGVAGTPWYSNMYFTWVNATQQDHADEVGVFWSAIDALIDNNVTWTVEPDVAVINDATLEITAMESVTPPTGAGASTSDPLPFQTQALVNWFTGTFVGGRQIRGKTYVPGLTESDNTAAGLLVAASQTIIQNAADALIANTSAPGPLRTFSRANLTSAVVVSANVPTKWAVLRSRRD